MIVRDDYVRTGLITPIFSRELLRGDAQLAPQIHLSSAADLERAAPALRHRNIRRNRASVISRAAPLLRLAAVCKVLPPSMCLGLMTSLCEEGDSGTCEIHPAWCRVA
jgi:hypothetical protein